MPPNRSPRSTPRWTLGPRALRALVGLVMVIFFGLMAMALKPRSLPERSELVTLRDRLEARLLEGWRGRGFVRPDGCIYTVDVGHLLIYAVGRRDRALYTELRPAADRLVRDDRSDPYTKGFVPWRLCGDEAPDASGTTEALRVAQGLWEGGAAFDLPADQAVARTILDGYGRHAYVDRGVWLVRNYFNFQTRGFANDSYLVDYDPDLVDRVARATGDSALAELARRSNTVVADAVSPSGLIHTLVQPDLATIMPEAPISIFSPNDVIQVNNSCTVAERVVHTDPDSARGTLRFALRQGRSLRRAYHGRDGSPVDATTADSTAWSCLVRLAIGLDDREALEPLLWQATWGWRWLVDDPVERSYSVGEALLALDAVLALDPPVVR